MWCGARTRAAAERPQVRAREHGADGAADAGARVEAFARRSVTGRDDARERFISHFAQQGGGSDGDRPETEGAPADAPLAALPEAEARRLRETQARAAGAAPEDLGDDVVQATSALHREQLATEARDLSRTILADVAALGEAAPASHALSSWLSSTNAEAMSPALLQSVESVEELGALRLSLRQQQYA